jgi:uroporphyrinogen-III synthase
LAQDLGARLRAGERVLVVRPESDSAFPLAPLESARALIEAVAFYRTAPAPEAAAIAADLVRGNYAAAVVTAPSALAALSAAALANAKRVALGSTTAAALARAGVPAHAIAAAPTPAAVADALETL